MSSLDCRQALALLQDYLKREIDPQVADDMQRHLERCRPCFRHAKFEANFLMMLETRAGKETCPGKVRARILAMLRAEAEGD
ncbi:MAG TPA: zf-HC2 domain-containing protein [Gemmatimonadales bacterium]|nr:zf-HC2 domain-containing protein [Gemmatimonadales bacterium]